MIQTETTMTPHQHNDEDLAINVDNVALVIEGGGMRASYTAGAIVTLLENRINFKDVYGISAGSSHAVNYVSRDLARTKASFVDLLRDPNYGGVKSFLQGKGYFNAHYLYEGIAEDLAGTGELFEFDWDTFSRNPANVHIEAFDWESGETVTWTKQDMPTMHDMLLRVRASSTMPIFMPPTVIEGRTYMDGGLGTSWGIPLDTAIRDGYDRFFIVRTQPRSYRKEPIDKGAQAMFKTAFCKHPYVWRQTIERPYYYNELCDQIEKLEAAGVAYVFYPDEMNVTNRTTDTQLLQASYEAGYAQAQRELSLWQQWLR
jgi:predicted patatin/cPLA2 family phospholipase